MSDTKNCPYCGEQIKSIALKCKHCGKSLIDEPSPEEVSSNLFWDGMGGDNTRLTETPAAPASDDPEEQIKIALSDKYEIIEEVGRGGMAIIYKAVQRNLNREVALKVLPKHFVHDEEYLIRFHREAREVAKLNHTNIVTIFDEGEKDGIHYLAMEFLEGKDLQEIIKEGGSLGVARTVEIISAISDALDYVHKNGLVHRDIKSSNVFILKNGRSVLTDFGIARTASKTKLTQAGTVMGTPDYMSPEQAEGGEVDGRSDIYGLGIVIYECLTGTVPFKSENPLTQIRKIIDETPESPRKINPDIPRWLNDLILKTIEKSPDDRILTGEFLAKSLREQKVIPGNLEDFKKRDKPKADLISDQQGKNSNVKTKDDLSQYMAARGTVGVKRKSKSAGVFIIIIVSIIIIAAAGYFLFINKKPAANVDSGNEQTQSNEQNKSPDIEQAKTDSETNAASADSVKLISTDDKKDSLAAVVPVPDTIKETQPDDVEKAVDKSPKEAVAPKEEVTQEDLEKARREQTAKRIRQLEYQLKRAKEAEFEAKKKYDHAKKMRKRNLLSPSDLRDAQSAYEKSKAKVEELQISLRVLRNR